ncbi:glycosyltransferase family 2 protein [Candidatus Peregrinibacteria bacterium]|nr:glycosyltransferase family 2 protein [Candidatus Peregrinibacteria bacterium]
MLSILVPVFNEEGAIEETLRTLDGVLRMAGEPYEIVVIDDGSRDHTPHILASLSLPALRVITHPQNRGYGSSMKTGIRQSKGKIIGTVDADGTYPLTMFGTLLTDIKSTNADMVVGARTKKGARVPLIRKPAKWMVNALANTLAHSRPQLRHAPLFTRTRGTVHASLSPTIFFYDHHHARGAHE